MAKVSNTSKILQSAVNLDALGNLEKLIQLEKPIAFAGAGLSIPAGMPSWNELLNRMDKKLGLVDDRYMGLLRTDPDLLWRAEEYRRMMDGMDKKGFYRLMKQAFGKTVVLRKDDPSVQFVKLPFRHFITTNYDDVLMTAHELAGLPTPRRRNWFVDKDVTAFVHGLRDGNRPRNILHLHGHHSEPESIILSDSDYTSRYAGKSATAMKLFAIFSTERVVFAGFSMTDQYLQSMLRDVNATMVDAEGPRHFAILGVDESKSSEVLERKRLLMRYSIDPVFYDSSGNDHSGLLEILVRLAEAAKREFSVGRHYDVLPEKQNTSGGTIPPLTVYNPDDPEKGRWGGQATANGRKVTATVKELEVDWFEVKIKVESTNPKKPLTGDVIFHLHPTFVPSVRVVRARSGKPAILTVRSYGAYTVGVEADRGQTTLELDLAEIKGAPLMFRLN